MGLIKQLELFFSDPPETQPVPPPAPAARPLSIVPISCPPSLPAGCRWREVQAPEQKIGYVLQRSRRKSIGLTINDDGLQVRAPNWITLSQIDAAVIEKSAWVLEKLRLSQARQQQLETAEAQWHHGGRIPYMGKRIVLTLDNTRRAAGFAGVRFTPRDNDALFLPLPLDADRNRIRDSAHVWLQQQAQAWFDERLRHFLAVSNLTMRRWRLSSAATRWGSCSSDGNIMLNWRLIHFQPDIIDYVIAHEIAHLRELNHSKDFWREVERILPGFEQARDALRQHNPGSLPLI
ncbi:M48 family metallopeptidase [Pusillimonas sp. MFBS29]|uniref:M48 family metallopeptidase n=1 Tax=Pusillimonas sp. MFBS29 TaxID=2886690 RepID=UPI001D116514|nr:SprT family zinc-dependent metalloprotease [Pusillimonas sp. MFBS29]MCC2597410.1 M48 family metallopeptidase [Pusillimonas sp. MFBS29]